MAEHDRELKDRITELERQLFDLKGAPGSPLGPEDIFRRMAEHSREVFWIRDHASGRFVYVSPSYENIYGRRREDLFDDPQDFLQAVHPEDRPGLQAAIQGQDRGGPHVSREFRLILPDGSIRWISARTFPLSDPDGRVDRIVGLAEDVTRRKAVEARLGQSESLLASVIDQSPTPMWVSDDQGTLIRLNQACRRLLDIADEEVIGKYNLLADNIVAEQGLLPLVESVFQDGQTVNFKIVYDSSQLKTIDLEKTAVAVLETTISPVRNAEGRIVNAVVQHQDITERELAKSKLEESAANYRAIFEAVNDAIFVHDMETGAILDVNQKMVELYGYTPEEARRLDVEAVSSGEPPYTQEEALRWIQKAVAGSPQLFEWRAKDINGRSFWVEVNLKRATIGGQDRLLAVVRDISERKIAEDELRESEQRYRDLYETVPTALFTVRAEDGAITSCNSAAWRMLGYTRQELLNMKVDDLYADTPEGIVKARDRFARFQRGESLRDVTLEMKHKDGHSIWISLSVDPIADAQGKIIESRSVAVDITERNRLEEQLRQAQKMEAVGTLAGGVAHDFNNLMTAVTGFGQFALDDLNPDHPAYQDILEVIKAGERATSLTRQLLAFSRKQILEPKVVDLNAIVANMEKMLGRLIGEDIDIRTVLDEDLGRVKVDPGQVEQIVMNLAVNARDAMPTGGKLTIETANVHLDQTYASQHADMGVTPGRHVMLAVSDSGPGMDETVRAKIFEPFFTTKGRAESTGLGLSTVYGIVKQSGGDIHVYSEPGQGTTFKIYFRRVAEAAEPLEPVRSLPARVEGAGVALIVEDEDAVRSLISRTLSARGYQVMAAADGREALELSDRYQGEIDLLLTDVVMPLMSGRELAERVARSRPDLKVLYMSGYTDNVVAHHGVLDAGVAFISKPFSTEDLVKKIQKVLGG